MFRKIIVRFKDEASMDLLSDKLFAGTDYKLLRNMKTVKLDDSFEFVFKRNTNSKPRQTKEWEKHWVDFFPFSWEKKKSWGKIEFLFSEDYNNDKLATLFDQNITNKSKSIHFPVHAEPSENLIRVIGSRPNPQYPIYVVSKGRPKTCITADHLVKLDVPFRIIVEQSDYDAYAENYTEDQLLVLDQKFKTEYPTYIKGADNGSTGPGPARNFAWWHAQTVLGAEWHWVMDDNMYGFTYYKDQKRLKAADGTVLSAAEDFVNRYDNIGISGLNYYAFAVPGTKDRPYVANTKIYSCLLINNSIPIRWAGRYNEDVDICIRAMKAGYSTIQFDAFLAKKAGTQTMAGGNTAEFYAAEGTLPKSNMLAYTHPDNTHVQWRFKRWHHMTNYLEFSANAKRTISETIKDMLKEPVLDRVIDADIIEAIKAIDFEWIRDWDILNDFDSTKRTAVIAELKRYKYLVNHEEIINKLCEEKLINCDYYQYIWDKDVPSTPDNKLMIQLLELGDSDGVLRKFVDWSKFNYIEPERLARIKVELQRNKYLFKKEFETFPCNLQQFTLTEENHALHHDSKARIYNEFVTHDDELDVPVTLYDKHIRSELKAERKSFKVNLTGREQLATKEQESYAVMIHGDSGFDDSIAFNEALILPENCTEIINAVYNPVDLMSARYALENKIKNVEFVPDETRYSDAMYRILYQQMVNYADECFLFLSCSAPDTDYLIELFNKANKKITIIESKGQTESLDEW